MSSTNMTGRMEKMLIYFCVVSSSATVYKIVLRPYIAGLCPIQKRVSDRSEPVRSVLLTTKSCLYPGKLLDDLQYNQ